MCLGTVLPLCCTEASQLGLRGQAPAATSQAGLLSQLIYPLQAGRIVISADLCSPGCNPLQAAARTPALGQLQAGPGEQPPRWHSSTPRRVTCQVTSVFLTSCPAGNPCDHPCKASFPCKAAGWLKFELPEVLNRKSYVRLPKIQPLLLP